MPPGTKPQAEVRVYRVVKDADDEFLNSQLRRKNYWSKYPELKQMKNVIKKRLISHMFFASMFLLSTSEFYGISNFGSRCLVAQLLVTIFALFVAITFKTSMSELSIVLMIPYMALVMAGLSFYIILLGFMIFLVLTVPPFNYFLLVFYFFQLGVTVHAIFSFGRCTDWLWQGLFTMIDVTGNEELVKKLKTNALIEEEDDEDRKKSKKNKKKGFGTAKLLLAGRKVF